MISPTFQRISYSPVQDKTFSASFSPLSIISPSLEFANDLIPSVCSTQSYDNICLITSDSSTTQLSYPNVTLLKSVPINKVSSSPFSTRITTSRYTTLYSTSTLSYQDFNFSTLIPSNSTHPHDYPPLVISVRSPTTNRFRRFFHWQYIWIILVPLIVGILLCLVIGILAFIKYRRKDVGVYEVEEAQRFRPLIVELTPSPGERNQENVNSTTTTTTTSLATLPTAHVTKKDTQKKRKRKKSPLTSPDEQREFYI